VKPLTVLWQINLEHQDTSEENIRNLVARIFEEFKKTHYCRPRRILLAANGPGAVVGEALIARGLPVRIVSPSEWRQLVDPLIDGPSQHGETCL
jgi:hypothetical protein